MWLPMGELFHLKDAIERKRLTVDEAWQAYVEAQDKAKRTLNIQDGIEAGKAWGNFIGLFVRSR